MLGISIENMTKASCLLYIVSGAFGVSAVVLFFLLDIMKCWKMVSRKVFSSFPAKQISKPGAHSRKPKLFKNEPLQETVLLSNKYETKNISPQETDLLYNEYGLESISPQETILLNNEYELESMPSQETILLSSEYGLESTSPQETVLSGSEYELESTPTQETVLLDCREYGNVTKL